MILLLTISLFFFFNDTATTEIYTLSLHDALPIYWDWPGAMREYARALELNPGFATAHHWYSFVLLVSGQAEQAVMEALTRSEEHTSELQSQSNIVCRLLPEKKKKKCKI